MENQEILQTIAEVSVALVGFSGIVVTLGRRRSWNNKEILKLTVMLRASLSAMFLSFVPILVHLFFPDSRYWQLSIGLLSLVMISNLTVMLYRAKGAGLTISQKFLFPPGAAIAVSALLAAFSIFDAAKMYILALVWMLLIGTHNFILLLIDSLVLEKESEQSVDDHIADR